MNKKKSLLPFVFLSSFVLTSTLVLSGCEKSSQVSHEFKKEKSISSAILHNATQNDIDNIAKNLDVKYRLVSNIPTEHCDENISDGACFEVELSFTAKQAIAAKGWGIYFSQISPVQSSESNEFTVNHVNGDLHQILLKDSFSGFKAGETKKITFRANFWMLSETDALPNYVITAADLKAKVIESTKVAINPDSGLEILPFVVPFTDEEKQFKRTAQDSTQWLTSEKLYRRNKTISSVNELALNRAIIPTPKHVSYPKNNGILDLSKGLNLKLINVEKTQIDSALQRLSLLGLSFNERGIPVVLSIVEDNSKLIGSYHLSVDDRKINIIGVDATGVFYGLESLASLYRVGASSIPQMTVDDEPHYAFRGMLVDVARNFHSKDFILKLLAQMAAYKLNKLHLHLGDDEGWRIEIPGLPELTDVSSKRCFDTQEQDCLMTQLGAGVDSHSSVNGFYSVQDYSEILKAATARHIQVIPSLDMPGHSRAAIKAMTARYNKFQALENEQKAKQYLLEDFNDNTQYSSVQYYNDNTMNVCQESTYHFITEVMKEVKQIHAEAGQPLTRYHIGADETAGAWIESPVCKDFIANNDKGVTKMSELGAYFIERVAGILSDLDIETAGWSDGMEHTRKENMPAIVQANAWDVLSWGGHQKVHELVNRDWQVVISSPDVLYFDFPYEADPKEHGYYWASRHTNTEKVFQFMPDNLPVHAEFWLDRQDNNYVADDTKSMMKPAGKFLGIQGQLWSENTRNDVLVEHKIFPRLLALAERAWYLPNWAVPYNYQGYKYSKDTHVFTTKMKKARDDSWRLFANTLGQKVFAKLELSNIHYRLPTVGAEIKQGKLYANIAFPGLVIEYKQGKQPWKTYTKPVDVEGEVKLRSKSLNDKRSSRVTSVNGK